MPAGSASVAASGSTGTASSSSVGSPAASTLRKRMKGGPGGLHARRGETAEELGEGAVDGGLDGAGDLAAQAEVGLCGPL